MLRLTLVISLLALTLLACAPATIAPNPTGGADGRLDAGDAQLDSGEYFETHSYAGKAGDLLTISLTSNDIDPYLMVVDPDGEKLAEEDDSPGHGHNVVITVNLPVDGSYTLIVTSFEPGEVGSYTLELAPGARLTPGRASPSPVWAPAGTAATPASARRQAGG